ncbi:MAG: RNA-binding domain-containing protein [Methanothrix sp.]|nr:RNA-binding domain-containing protein [Methanothrix sp.]
MIERVSFRAFVAATEDEERVRGAMGICVPIDRISTTVARGHFGNEIKILEGSLRRKEGLSFFGVLREGLPPGDLSRLRSELQERLDEDLIFHLRLDKQSAYRGMLRLTDSKDALDVSVAVRTYPARRDSALSILSGLL